LIKICDLDFRHRCATFHKEKDLGLIGPPSTSDFLTPLRNNFETIIVPLLDQKAREAFLQKMPPESMSDIEGKRVKFKILHTVYGKN
jgi:hypothetical protein